MDFRGHCMQSSSGRSGVRGGFYGAMHAVISKEWRKSWTLRGTACSHQEGAELTTINLTKTIKVNAVSLH